MRVQAGLGIALVFVSTCATAAEKAPAILSVKDRSAIAGSAIQVTLAQTQIETNIDLGRIAPAGSGGGLLGAIIIESRDDRRQIMSRSLSAKADMLVAPLRQALNDFELDALALQTTKAALANPDGVKALTISATKNVSRVAFLASNTLPDLSFIDYRYDLSPDFSQIRVIADIALFRPTGTRSSDVIPSSSSIYKQRIYSIVQLRKPSYEPRENVARWSANEGKLAEESLTTAFDKLQQLIPYILRLDKRDVDTFMAKDREKAFAAGFYGPVISDRATGADDILIWSDGFVQVHYVQ